MAKRPITKLFKNPATGQMEPRIVGYETVKNNTTSSTSSSKKTSPNKLSGAYMDAYNKYAAQQNTALKKQKQNLQNQYNDQVTALGNQLATSKQNTSEGYDSNAAQAYINYAKQQNQLGEQLAQQGINGGASESAMVNMQNNYAQNVSANNASKAAAIAALQNSYDNNIANLKQQLSESLANMDYDNARDLASQLLTAQQNQISYNDTVAEREWQRQDTLNQRDLEQYSATLERFTSVDACKRAISKLSKKDPNYKAKKRLLQLRMAQLQGVSTGGGGGGYSSGGYGYGSYGYGDDSGGDGGGNSGGGILTQIALNALNNAGKTQSKGNAVSNAITQGVNYISGSAPKKSTKVKKTKGKYSGSGKNTQQYK